MLRLSRSKRTLFLPMRKAEKVNITGEKQKKMILLTKIILGLALMERLECHERSKKKSCFYVYMFASKIKMVHHIILYLQLFRTIYGMDWIEFIARLSLSS